MVFIYIVDGFIGFYWISFEYKDTNLLFCCLALNLSQWSSSNLKKNNSYAIVGEVQFADNWHLAIIGPDQ